MSKATNTVPFYEDIEIPEDQRRLKILQKVPIFSAGMRPEKMSRRYELVRGEEEVHTDFRHKQYGIVALRGGWLKFGHIEMIRMTIGKKLDAKRMFAIWRIPDPWKSHTKRPIGKTLGGGRPNISYYTTPVKAKRVIIEVGGRCTFKEIHRFLKDIADKLPFPAKAMTQEMIEEERALEQRMEDENLNRFTFKYILQNNLLGSQDWAKKNDYKYWGKYI